MKTELTATRVSDGKGFKMSFKSKKDARRFLANNYTTYRL